MMGSRHATRRRRPTGGVGDIFPSGWNDRQSLWRIGRMPAWTSAEILICCCLLESSGMTVVRHLISFFYFLFL